MYTFAISTPIVRPHDDLLAIIDQAIAADARLQGKLKEGSVLAISSKIISYCQGRLVAKKHSEAQGFSKEEARAEKHVLVAQEADLYLDPDSSQYNLMLTIKNSTLAVNAGVDESNANLDGEECFVLWPEQMRATLNQVWRHCRAKYKLQNFGVITTDSRTFPLRWGVVGTTLAYCGFKGLNNHIGEHDIFGREILMEQVNVAEALGVAATFVMGEIAETTPLALLSELEKVQFVDHEPDEAELASGYIDIADDVYAPLLEKAIWHKGGGHYDANDQ
jgi:F420-0:gamma-glutamyl ligase